MAVLTVPRSVEYTVQYRYFTLMLYLSGARKVQPFPYPQFHLSEMLPPPTKIKQSQSYWPLCRVYSESDGLPTATYCNGNTSRAAFCWRRTNMGGSGTWTLSCPLVQIPPSCCKAQRNHQLTFCQYGDETHHLRGRGMCLLPTISLG